VFALAPYVHPFRSPSNRAPRLHSLQVARDNGSRLLWVVAYDNLRSREKVSAKGQSTKTMQIRITYDDRRTASIPGFFPLVLDLPMRFTCENVLGDRLQGIFIDVCARLGAHVKGGGKTRPQLRTQECPRRTTHVALHRDGDASS